MKFPETPEPGEQDQRQGREKKYGQIMRGELVDKYLAALKKTCFVRIAADGSKAGHVVTRNPHLDWTASGTISGLLRKILIITGS
jgi:hypothetical protein